ncbi:MAG: hypothetical protein ACOYKE_11480 [Ferruginibacter sp.]
MKKFDKSFEEVYSENYKKELSGLDFLSFQPLDNDLFVFATDFIKKEKAYKVYGAKVNQTDGTLQNEFIEMGSYERESKKDDFEAKLESINNKQNFLLVCDLTGKNNTRLAVTVLDKNLKQQSTTNIVLSFLPGFYTLQDVKLVNNTIVVLGRSFEEVAWKRKRKKKVFKKFELSLYALDGTKLKDISLERENKFTLEGRLLELNGNQVALAGLYSDDAKKKKLNGFFIDKVDITTGLLTVSSTKPITEDMIGKNFTDEADDDDDDDESKKAKKEKEKAQKNDDVDELPNQYKIKEILINPTDGSFIISAEISEINVFTYYTSDASGLGSGTPTTVYEFTNKDIILICADNKGAIKWLNAIPKKQFESNSRVYRSIIGFDIESDYYGYFSRSGGMPFLSSFSSAIINNKLILLYNDHRTNAVIANYGDKVKSISNFKKKGELFAMSFDIATGKATKKSIASCADDDVITMPRHAMVIGNTFIVPAWRQRALGKTIFKIAEVTVK